MAINNPLKESVDAAGGYIVPDDVARETLIKGLLTETPTLSLAGNTGVTSSKKVTIPVMTDFPTAAFVGETAAKPTTGGEFGQVVLNVKKIAAIVPFSDELLEDAVVDPTILMSDQVRVAFGRLIDRHILGFDGTAAVTTSFDNRLYGTTQTADLGTDLRLTISDAMADVEAAGYTPNGVILPSDARRYLRDGRRQVETKDPLYTSTDWAYGMNTAYSSNLYGLGAAEADGKMVGIVGDWSNLIVRIRSDISVASSNQATVTIGGSAVNLWETNMTALRFEMRLGVVAHDLNRAFCKLTNEDNS